MGFWSGDSNSCIWVTNQYHRHMFVWKFSSQRRTVSPPILNHPVYIPMCLLHQRWRQHILVSDNTQSFPMKKNLQYNRLAGVK